MAKLLLEEEKKSRSFGSRRRYSRLSLMNARSNSQFQRQLLAAGGGIASRRHWSLNDIPKTRLEMMQNRRWNTGFDITENSGLTRRLAYVIYSIWGIGSISISFSLNKCLNSKLDLPTNNHALCMFSGGTACPMMNFYEHL